MTNAAREAGDLVAELRERVALQPVLLEAAPAPATVHQVRGEPFGVQSRFDTGAAIEVLERDRTGVSGGDDVLEHGQIRRGGSGTPMRVR
jgi:hypothetical protein